MRSSATPLRTSRAVIEMISNAGATDTRFQSWPGTPPLVCFARFSRVIEETSIVSACAVEAAISASATASELGMRIGPSVR